MLGDTVPESPTGESQEEIAEEISRLRARLAELESQLEPPKQDLVQDSLLREAIETLVDGFSLFDEHQNLVYCNARYRELYWPLSDDWEPGINLAAIARESAGQVLRIPDDDIDAFVERRLNLNRAGDGSWQEQQLTDGRHFRVTEKRLASGWVVGIRTDITNLRRAEAELRWLLDSMDQSDDGYAIFDADDRLVACNRTWREVHNPTIADLLVAGTSFTRLMQALLDRGQIPEAAGRKEQWLEERLKRHRHPSGSFAVHRKPDIWHQVTETRLTEGGVVLLCTDISELKAQESALKKVEATWLDAIASMSEGFSYWDENDKLVICNDTYKEMFAPIADALKPGASFTDLGRLMVERGGLAPAENSHDWMAGRNRRRTHNEAIEFHFADGRWIRCIDAQTRDGGRLCFRIDITEEKRSAAALSTALDAAEQANRAKTAFLATMSHELRTPLNAILGFAQLLQAGKGDALGQQQSEYVEQVHRAGKHLLGLIDEILDLATVESGQLHMVTEAVRVETVLAECSELVEPLAATLAIQFTEDVAPNLPDVEADALRLKQIVLNLLSNAVKYNRPHGSVHVSVEPVIAGREPPPAVRLQVSDTGKGIEPGEIERLFEPFDRLNESEHTSEGTGIGLSITRKLVEAMNGNLSVHSRPGQGSTFTVDLPTRSAAPVQEPQFSSPTDKSLAQSTRVPKVAKVLYIEDDPANARLMRRIVETLPETELIHARAGQLGLDLARREHPQLVLLDMNLPDMSGQEVAQRLQGEPLLSSVPIVAVTGDATRFSVECQSDPTYHAVVKKPFSIEALRDIVERALRSR